MKITVSRKGIEAIENEIRDQIADRIEAKRSRKSKIMNQYLTSVDHFQYTRRPRNRESQLSDRKGGDTKRSYHGSLTFKAKNSPEFNLSNLRRHSKLLGNKTDSPDQQQYRNLDYEARGMNDTQNSQKTLFPKKSIKSRFPVLGESTRSINSRGTLRRVLNAQRTPSDGFQTDRSLQNPKNRFNVFCETLDSFKTGSHFLRAKLSKISDVAHKKRRLMGIEDNIKKLKKSKNFSGKKPKNRRKESSVPHRRRKRSSLGFRKYSMERSRSSESFPKNQKNSTTGFQNDSKISKNTLNGFSEGNLGRLNTQLLKLENEKHFFEKEVLRNKMNDYRSFSNQINGIQKMRKLRIEHRAAESQYTRRMKKILKKVDLATAAKNKKSEVDRIMKDMGAINEQISSKLKSVLNRKIRSPVFEALERKKKIKRIEQVGGLQRGIGHHKRSRSTQNRGLGGRGRLLRRKIGKAFFGSIQVEKKADKGKVKEYERFRRLNSKSNFTSSHSLQKTRMVDYASVESSVLQ